MREALAELEHDQWTLWTAYMLDALQPLIGGEENSTWEQVDLARKRLEGWRLQIATPYADLTEADKDKDREWADKCSRSSVAG